MLDSSCSFVYFFPPSQLQRENELLVKRSTACKSQRDVVAVRFFVQRRRSL